MEEESADPRYSYFIRNHLQCSSPSVDWSTEITYHQQTGCSIHRVVFTTCFLGTNYLIVDSIMSSEGDDSDDDEPDIDDPALAETEIEHSVGLIKARFMPQDPRQIAAISAVGEIILYSLTEARYSSERRPEYTKTILSGGNGIAGRTLTWNENLTGVVLSATYDGTINVHDIVQQSIPCTFRISNHMPIDACWNKTESFLFGSVGADHTCKLWDTRFPQPCYDLRVHRGAANSIDFSPLYPNIFITGGSDHNVSVWDCRSLHRCLTRTTENSPVMKVSYSQLNGNIFASSGLDNEVRMYRCTETQDVFQFFRHYKHNATVLDFAWHPFRDAIGSVDQCQEIHVWEPSLAAYRFDIE